LYFTEGAYFLTWGTVDDANKFNFGWCGVPTLILANRHKSMSGDLDRCIPLRNGKRFGSNGTARVGQLQKRRSSA